MRFAFRDIRLITSIVLVAVILLAASVPTGAQPYAVPLTWVRQITQEMPEGRQFAMQDRLTACSRRVVTAPELTPAPFPH